MNRVTNYTDQEGGTKTYAYDKDSLPTQTTREDSSTVTTQYTETGQVKHIDYPGTERDLSYGYDALGRVTSETLGSGTPKTTTYDHAGRILSKDGISYEYDELGNQTKITYPSGRTADYAYDANSNLTTANISGVGTATYTHDANDAITTVQLPNGVTETNTRDALGRVTDMTMSNPTQELHKYKKTYDSLGNMSGSSYGLVTQQKTETYTHDKVDRLTNVTSDIAGNNATNDYNLANHLTKFEGKNVAVDKIGAPQAVGTQELSYDELGNRTNISDSTNPTAPKTYEWSVDNLLSGTNAGTSEIDYQYDSSGLLNERTENSQTDEFIWDKTASNALLLSDGDYEYVYGANRVPLAQIDLSDNSIEYLHADINGSVIAVTTDNGYLGGITNYGAYGKRQGSAISRFGFAGEWTDPTTSYTYLRARWYDPSTGSFLSKDPLYELTQEAYGYANGNPLTNIDPSGLMFRNPINDYMSFINRKFEEGVYRAKSAVSKTTNCVKEAVKKTVQFGINNFNTARKIASKGMYQVAENMEFVRDKIIIPPTVIALNYSDEASLALGSTSIVAPNPYTAGASLGLGGISFLYEKYKCDNEIEGLPCDETTKNLAGASSVAGASSLVLSKVSSYGKILDLASIGISIVSFSRDRILDKHENYKKDKK